LFGVVVLDIPACCSDALNGTPTKSTSPAKKNDVDRHKRAVPLFKGLGIEFHEYLLRRRVRRWDRHGSGSRAVVAMAWLWRRVEFPLIEFEGGQREPERGIDARLEGCALQRAWAVLRRDWRGPSRLC
jgi:hypothetical protein